MDSRNELCAVVTGLPALVLLLLAMMVQPHIMAANIGSGILFWKKVVHHQGSRLPSPVTIAASHPRKRGLRRLCDCKYNFGDFASIVFAFICHRVAVELRNLKVLHDSASAQSLVCTPALRLVPRPRRYTIYLRV